MSVNANLDDRVAAHGPLKRFASVRNGYAFRESVMDDPEGDTRVLQLRDVDQQGYIDIEELPMIAFGKRAQRHVLHPGDVLIAGRGGKSTAFSVPLNVPMIPAAGLLVINPDNALDSAYLRWFLNHPNTQRRLHALREGSNLQFIDKAGLESLHIFVPDIPVQQYIAELDADLRRRIELRIRLNEVEAQLLDGATWQIAKIENLQNEVNSTQKILIP
ncbi:restriction endonuclease subunit S [Granulosicoccus sp.]|nr:restriction endonuclease subunit S [Granulosicoccus sp.]